MQPYRIIHFVCGGPNTGSTNIAVNLAIGHHQGKTFEPLLIFRGEPSTELAKELQEKNIPWFATPWNPKSQIISQLIRHFRDFKPAIFVAHGYREHVFGRIAAVIAKVPLIFQVEHNTDIYELHRYLESQILTFFTKKIICVSEGVRKHLAHWGFNPNKLTVIKNGIHVEKFLSLSKKGFKERNPNLVMAARFCKQKDHLTLIKAMAYLIQQGYKCQLLLLGEGQERYKVKAQQLCTKLNLDNFVKFLGFVDTQTHQASLADNQIFVLSTHYEGLPSSIIEGMLAGCIVIGSDVVGVSELIQDGKTGFLVPPKNPKVLAEKIQSILTNQVAAEQIALEGHKYAQANFTFQRMIKEYEDLFIEELQKTKVKP